MVPVASSVQGDLPVLWQTSPQSVCHLGQHKAAALRVTISRSSSLEAGSSSSSVGPSVRLCLPPVAVCAATSGHHAGSGVGGSVFGSRSSRVASEGMIFTSAGSSCSRTTLTSEGLESACSSSCEEVSPKPQDPPTSRVELIQ